MNKLTRLVIVFLLAFLGSACASAPAQPATPPPQATATTGIMSVATELPVPTLENAAPTAAPTSAPEQPTAAPATAQASGRDFSQIDACSLITDQEVAQMDNGTVQSPAQSSNLGDTRGCSYGVTTAGGGYDNVIIYVEPPDLIEATLALADDKGAPVAGIGDQAFIQNEIDVGQYHLLAERQGDVGIEVIGENSDVVVAIAKLLLTRLP